MPLTFDLPIEQLDGYMGSSPWPDDFDEYWQLGLEEMRQVEAQVELRPADFTTSFCECFDMYFSGVRGARIHAKLLKPKKNREPGPAVLMFHGYTGNAGDWNDKLGYAAQGFTVAAMDCRGQGGDSQDTGGVSGNTLHGHIIRGLQDALNGKPENLLFPTGISGCCPVGRYRHGYAGCGRGKGGRVGRQPRRRSNSGLRCPGTPYQTGCSALSFFK